MSFNYKEKLPSESQGQLIEKRSGYCQQNSRDDQRVPITFSYRTGWCGNKIYAQGFPVLRVNVSYEDFARSSQLAVPGSRKMRLAHVQNGCKIYITLDQNRQFQLKCVIKGTKSSLFMKLPMQASTLIHFVSEYGKTCPILANSRKTCMNRVRSLLSLRCLLLAYNFQPRLNSCAHGTSGLSQL